MRRVLTMHTATAITERNIMLILLSFAHNKFIIANRYINLLVGFILIRISIGVEDWEAMIQNPAQFQALGSQ